MRNIEGDSGKFAGFREPVFGAMQDKSQAGREHEHHKEVSNNEYECQSSELWYMVRTAYVFYCRMQNEEERAFRRPVDSLMERGGDPGSPPR